VSPRRLGGDLNAFGLPELVQSLVQGRKTARVVLHAGALHGHIWFADGELVHAATGNLAGDLAFFAMMGWTRGDFEVDYDAASAVRSISQDATFLVLEGLRRIDERRAERAIVPAAPVAHRRRAVLASVAAGIAAAAMLASMFFGGPQSGAPDAVAAVPDPSFRAPVAAPPAIHRTKTRPNPTKTAAIAVAPPLAAPESLTAEEAVPFAVEVVAVPEPAPPVVASVPSSRLLVSGKSSAAGGAVVLLVDGKRVFAHGPLDADGAFEATLDVPAGAHEIVARLETDAREVHEDSVRAELFEGEERELRITANRRIGAPVKLKLGRTR
jgi:hypothetical protein